MHAICMLDVDGFKKQLDQIKIMMNKTTLAAASTHKRFSASPQPLPDGQLMGGSLGTEENSLPSPLRLALPLHCS